MADTKISNLTALAEAPASGDLLAVVDVSASETKKLTVANLIDAVEGNANTFTKAQIINVSSGVPLTVQLSSASRLTVNQSATVSNIALSAADLGDVVGPAVSINNNTNATTPSSGHLRITNLNGTVYRIWPDSSGNLRIGTSSPTNANDTSGTVIGTQTSWHELKENVIEWDGAEALAAIQALTLYSYRMIEDGQKTPDGEKPTYYGLVITEEDREANAWFALGLAENQIPALNDRTIFGYLLAAVRHGANIIGGLQAQLAALEERVTALE